jgi:hypothetical protein
MGDFACELSHGGDVDGNASPGEFRWRRVGEGDAGTEHGDVVDAASALRWVAFNTAKTVPAGTKALGSTVIRHGEPFLSMLSGPASTTGRSAPDDDLCARS